MSAALAHPFVVDTPAKRLLFHTVRVETTLADGGSGTGTAFVIEHVHARGRTRFVVTNRHLVDDVTQGALVFHTRSRAGIGRWKPPGIAMRSLKPRNSSG